MYSIQLETFLYAAQMGSFSRAADKLYISPNAVLKQINSLEERLGVKLFTRTHRGIELTEGGKILYKEAEFIINYCNNAVNRAKAAMSGEVISLGFDEDKELEREALTV